MPLLIKRTPDSLSSLHDDIIFTVSETDKTADPVGYPNYKFIADVYVGSELVARLKKVQDPETGIGIFNIGQIVRNYVNTAFDPNINFVSQQFGEGSFSVTVTVKFGEEYAFTSYLDVVEDIPRTYFNHYNGRLVGVLTNLPFIANNVASDRPFFYTKMNSRFVFAPYFATNTSNVDVVVTPVGGGIPYAGTFAASVAYNMVILNIAPSAINALQPGTITSDTIYYLITIGGEEFKVKIVCEPLYTTYPVHFLNKWGGFETYLFTKVSRQRIDIDKKDYGKLAYTVDGAGNVGYRTALGVYNETQPVYASLYKEQLIINTDILTDREYEWLKQLISSPLVYVEDLTFLYPVVIKQSSYEPKKVVVDDLTNLEITVEFGNQLNAQFR